jgi:hypothetical protein
VTPRGGCGAHERVGVQQAASTEEGIAMIRVRRASLIATLSLVACAATAKRRVRLG